MACLVVVHGAWYTWACNEFSLVLQKIFSFLGTFQLQADIGNLVVDNLPFIICVLAKEKSTILMYGSLNIEFDRCDFGKIKFILFYKFVTFWLTFIVLLSLYEHAKFTSKRVESSNFLKSIHFIIWILLIFFINLVFCYLVVYDGFFFVWWMYFAMDACNYLHKFLYFLFVF